MPNRTDKVELLEYYEGNTLMARSVNGINLPVPIPIESIKKTLISAKEAKEWYLCQKR